jgi:Trypsin-like peptidase domain
MRFTTLVFGLLLASCQISQGGPKYPVTPEVAVDSTYMITVKLDNQEFKSGTAWIVAYKNDYSYLITAGHVCDDHVFAQELNLVMELVYKVKTYQLMDKNSNGYTVEEVARDFDILQPNKGDLCLLRVKGYLGDPLLISREDLYYNQRVDYVGAPRSLYGAGLAPTFSGVYCGKNWLCMPTAPGASGAAIFTREGVVGVLTNVHNDFPEMTFMRSRTALLDFLKKNGL